MKAAIYLRVSTEEQTVENQRPVLEQMARQRGYELVATFDDTGSRVKWREDERPGFAEMMRAAARARFQALFVWAIDRLGGSFYTGCRVVGDLDRFRVAVISHQETWCDTAGPFREPIIGFALRIAEEEHKRIGQRTRAGIVRARAAGKPHGRPAAVPDWLLDELVTLRGRGISWSKLSLWAEGKGLGAVSPQSLARAHARAIRKGVPPLRDGWQPTVRVSDGE